MRQNPTPMTKLALNFENLSALLTDDIEVLNLNKAKSRYRPVGYLSSENGFTKGVKSDFIRIYEHNNFTETMAFAFSYMHNREPSVIATKRIGKEGNYTFSTSKPMSLDDFRQRLNGFICVLRKNNPFNFPTLISLFAEQFLKDILESDTEFKEIKKLYIDAIAPVILAEENYQAEASVNKDQLETANKAATKEIQATDEYKQLEILRAQIRTLDSKVNVHRTNARTKHGLPALEAKQNDLRNDKYNTSRAVDTAKRKFLEQYPWYVIKELEPAFKL